MIEKGHTKGKYGQKGAYKCQNERHRLSKKLYLHKYQKVPRAYESLNPAMML
jgi:hypothetical protein